jgi:primary-amine oxidase
MRLGVLGTFGATLLHAAVAAAVCSSGTELVQAFPTSGGAVSEWKLCWKIERMPDELGALEASETLVISEATFRPGAAAPPVEVLGELRMVEIFVPYNSGGPRFHDLTGFNFDLQALSTTECPTTRLSGDRICVEVSDRDLAWRDPYVPVARRGERLVLWSILNAANYDYIMYYAFYDDGTIEVRAGSTGQKLGGPDASEGHEHLFAWRIDLDVAGAAGDTASVWNQAFGGKVVRGKGERIDTETGIPWAAEGFTVVEVDDATRTNANGRHTGYALKPLRSGLPKFREAWTRHPIWLTRAPGAGQELRAVDLPSYVNKEPVAGQNVVLWYLDTHHHEHDMRDEDRDTVPVLWTTFQLAPQNLWDGTPFYP